jgi:hypothetical protein
MSAWDEILESAAGPEHVVQLYGGNDEFLTQNLTRFVGDGLARGDGVVLIATPEHAAALSQALDAAGTSHSEMVRRGRLTVLDAGETLARITDGGTPTWERFEDVIGPILESARASSESGRVRAFGEMVGLLWTAGLHAEACELEGHWNRILDGQPVALYCAYPLDIHDGDCPADALKAILQSHTHMSTGPGTLFSSGRGRF